MKALFLTILTAFTLNLHAQTECEDNMDSARILCQASVDSCDEVKECLVRRDTCVESEPKTEQACRSLNTCMQDNSHSFNDYSRCDYTWAVPSSGEGFCRVKKHFLFSEEACPGRIHGLLNLMAYGLSSTVDSKYTCASVVKKRDQKAETCVELLAKVRRNCGEIPQNLKSFQNDSCEYSQKFTTYRNREFALDSSNSLRVNDGGRGNGAYPRATAPASGSTNSGTQR
ncbi:MAG: hypothetical protein CME71_12315 [Halobacteriovorax sp.]|nr:hypothetical protein [Halobacteriovorax sp.]